MRKVPLCSTLRERHPCSRQVNINTQQYLLPTPFSWLHYVCVHTQTCPTLVTPWTVPHQAHLSMGFSRQEYWSVVPFLSPSFRAHPAKRIRKVSQDKAQVLGIQSYGGLSVNPRKGAWCCPSHSLAHTASIIMGCKTNVVIVNFSPPGVHGNFQARILEWVVISSSGDLSNPGIEPAISCFSRWILYH